MVGKWVAEVVKWCNIGCFLIYYDTLIAFDVFVQVNLLQCIVQQLWLQCTIHLPVAILL